MKNLSMMSILAIALVMPASMPAIGNNTLEEGWVEIPRKESIEEGWVVAGKPSVSDAAYAKLGISKNASAFEILGVNKVTTPKDQIRNQYRALLQKWHPDKHGNAQYATEISQLLTWAYDQIK